MTLDAHTKTLFTEHKPHRVNEIAETLLERYTREEHHPQAAHACVSGALQYILRTAMQHHHELVAGYERELRVKETIIAEMDERLDAAVGGSTARAWSLSHANTARLFAAAAG